MLRALVLVVLGPALGTSTTAQAASRARRSVNAAAPRAAHVTVATPTSPSIKVTYFNGKGRAEAIRLALVAGGKCPGVRAALDSWCAHSI